MRTFSTLSKGYKALLLVSSASAFAMATPAYAQDEDEESAESDDQIVVTGSRILRQDYNSNSPMVTVDEDFLQQSSTGAVEQQLNKLPQFVVSQSSTVKNNEGIMLGAGGDIQPNATNTPGAATVSLRGVGANRTLVLIDGRRGVPGNASGAVDVSTIPSAALERVEIISGGASATYGADALAGVTNFILKKDFQGLELDASAGINQHGDGFEYTLSGIMGADFDDGRGNVSIAMSTNHRDLLLQVDHPFWQDLFENPNTTSGATFFVPRPGISSSFSGFGANFDPAAPPGPPPCEFSPGGCQITDYFNNLGASTPVPNDTNVYLNADGSLFTGVAGFFGSGFNDVGGSEFFQPWAALDQGYVWKDTAVGTKAAINAFTPLVVPTQRYNFLARGNYEINDWIGVFAQGMFSHSTTYTVQEPGPMTFGWDVVIPWGPGTYTGNVTGLFGAFGPIYDNPAVPSSVLADGVTTNPAFQAMFPFLNCVGYTTGVGGCTNTEAFQQAVPDDLEELLNNRADPNTSVHLNGFLPDLRETFSDVKTYNLIAGIEGSIPNTDWTYEAYVNHGVAQTLSRQTGMFSLERTRAVFTAPNFGQGFRFQGNAFGGAGGLSPGFGASTGTCTTGMNFFGGYEGVSEDCLEAIKSDVSNRATTRQTIAEVNLQGKIIDLPAGELRAALGASYRETRFEFTNETLSTFGRSFLDQVIGIYPSANMPSDGYDVKELYGEVLIPILSDIPFIQQFNLELGGRMSDYDTTGTSYTFKILGDWEVTDWLRFRGGFNRSERAPNIAELLLAPQQAFRTDITGDVCSTQHQSTESANPENNPDGALDIQAVCLALMQRDNGGVYVPITAPQSYYFDDGAGSVNARQPIAGGAGFGVAVGNAIYRDLINADFPALKPEVADTWTVGAVIQSPMTGGPLSRLNLTVDYFNIKINDPIGDIGAGGILLRCVSPLFNPAVSGVAAGASSADDLDDPAIRAAALAAIANDTCARAVRSPSVPGPFGPNGGLNSAQIQSTYDNDGVVKLSGLDATLNWSMDAGPGTVFLSLNGNYMFDFKVQPFAGAPTLDYVGTTGTGAKGLNFGSSIEYRIFGTLGYTWEGLNASLQWQHIPETDDACNAAWLNREITGATEPCDLSGLPAYNLFNFNSSYQLTDNVTIRFGVDNLFNKRPPLVGVDQDLDEDDDGVADEGALPGGGYSFFHDVQGRRFSLGANVKF